jgi:hypothetical protein
MCAVLLPPGVNQIVVKYIIIMSSVSNLNVGGQCETKQRLLKLIILVQENECCIIYSTKIAITVY